VGGESALNLAKALAPCGTLVTYGAMGKRPLTIPNAPLIFRELNLCGFWVTAWYERASAQEIQEMFESLLPLFADGTLDTFVEKRYRLNQIHEAVAHARRGGRQGKILLILDT
jgi:trans-2-enoyl-CoA reductase